MTKNSCGKDFRSNHWIKETWSKNFQKFSGIFFEFFLKILWPYFLIGNLFGHFFYVIKSPMFLGFSLHITHIHSCVLLDSICTPSHSWAKVKLAEGGTRGRGGGWDIVFKWWYMEGWAWLQSGSHHPTQKEPVTKMFMLHTLTQIEREREVHGTQSRPISLASIRCHGLVVSKPWDGRHEEGRRRRIMNPRAAHFHPNNTHARVTKPSHVVVCRYNVPWRAPKNFSLPTGAQLRREEERLAQKVWRSRMA